ncbi:MAG: hypothetical protein IJ455_06195 [Agathobacter sp.]|nr:hypothetical protein [Agathobacter sp.]
MELNTIIGYKRFRNEHNVERLVVHVVQKPEQDDVRNGHIGFIIADVWIPEKLFGRFTPDCVGKVLKASFELAGKYTRVVDVEFI